MSEEIQKEEVFKTSKDTSITFEPENSPDESLEDLEPTMDTLVGDVLTFEHLRQLGIKKMSQGKFVFSGGVKKDIKEVAQKIMDIHDIPLKTKEHHTLQSYLETYLSTRKHVASSSLLEGEYEYSEMIEGIDPVVDFKTGEIFFLASDSLELIPLHEDVYISSNNKGVESKKDLSRNCVKVIVEFNPDSKEKVYKQQHKGYQLTTINLYDEAPWLKNAPNNPHVIPELIENLFVNAFPDLPDREYVYQWFYRAACANKNETILCLIGSQGIGKDFLVNLLAHGVGKNFFQKADQSILDDKFNSQVKYCRLLFLDEVKVGSIVEDNKLKGMTSTNISYQSKGKDASTIDSYINIVLANNNKDAIPLRPGDRRYSVPKLGTKRLEAFFFEKYGEQKGSEKLNELVEYIYRGVIDSNGVKLEKPHDDIINFFHWLKNRYDGTGVNKKGNTAYQGDYYNELTLANMTEWQKRMFEVLTDDNCEPIVYLKDIKKTLDATAQTTFPSSTKTIEKFLDGYKHEGKIKIAEVLTIKIGNKSDKVLSLTKEYLEEKFPFDWEQKLEKRNKIVSGEFLEDFGQSKTPDQNLKVVDATEEDESELL